MSYNDYGVIKINFRGWLESDPPQRRVIINGKYSSMTEREINEYVKTHNLKFPGDKIDLNKHRGTYKDYT